MRALLLRAATQLCILVHCMATPPQPAQRILDSHGRINIVQTGGAARYFSDLYHFLLVSSWPRLLTLFVGGYVAGNVLFAALYMVG